MSHSLRRLSAFKLVLKVAESLGGFFLNAHNFCILVSETCHVLLYIYGWTDQILRPNKDLMICFDT